MTRVTAPINKLARSLGSHPSVARPAYLGNNGSHSAVGNALRSEGREDTARRFTTAHRPAPMPTPSPNHVVPLMQTFNFRTTIPQNAQVDTTTIDYIRLPDLASSSRASDGLSTSPIRVPLLPDNFHPDRSVSGGHPPEAMDGPGPAPEILVVAGDLNQVAAASPLAEVGGLGLDGEETAAAASAGESTGMVQDLWKGLLEDVLGPTQKNV